jgi:hypothetical protein
MDKLDIQTVNRALRSVAEVIRGRLIMAYAQNLTNEKADGLFLAIEILDDQIAYAEKIRNLQQQ